MLWDLRVESRLVPWVYFFNQFYVLGSKITNDVFFNKL